jgi:hypothetical protein
MQLAELCCATWKAAGCYAVMYGPYLSARLMLIAGQGSVGSKCCRMALLPGALLLFVPGVCAGCAQVHKQHTRHPCHEPESEDCNIFAILGKIACR